MKKLSDQPRELHETPTAEIAEQLGVSRQRVDQIADTAMTKLRKALEAKGIRFAKDILPD